MRSDRNLWRAALSRKIIQIASSSHPIDGNVIYALCDDGSLWARHGEVWDPVKQIPGTEAPATKRPRKFWAPNDPSSQVIAASLALAIILWIAS